MPFTIAHQDITKMKVDAVVNAANTDLAMGGGVCGAIFNAAGARELQAACDELAPIKTGEAVITPGFKLSAKHVIHAAGPIYRAEDAEQSERLLRAAYTNSLQLAFANKCESVAFPLISSGIYGYPKDEALRVATSAIRDFLADHDLNVYLAMVNKAVFAVSEELLSEVASYIDEHYVDVEVRDFHQYQWSVTEEEETPRHVLERSNLPNIQATLAPRAARGIEDLVGRLDEPFSVTLLHLIDAKGKTDAEVYRRANLDRRLFSRIRTIKNYMPSKRTAVALAVALELNLDETNDLLGRAGYVLSHSQKFDVIVEYFITNGKYDIFEINEMLFEHDQPPLGGVGG